ncbi:MAG: hypothetical protein ISS41_07340 [Candidatus Aminicenantes bacterium]|nr:hypothetical protein [Candidatus Aminicenantes bacterium]
MNILKKLDRYLENKYGEDISEKDSKSERKEREESIKKNPNKRKRTWIFPLIIGIILGFLLGTIITNRYEYRTVGKSLYRINKITGSATIIVSGETGALWY